MDDKRFAVLIDSDNISSRYISSILDEMTKYGTITYKRIYGDWTSTQTSKWKQELLENSITPIQQFSNTTGKNATDSALIIDAMDILYTNNVDGFCIVSSDSDFTRLASRLRESGMEVIGMGEEKTPRSFRAACSVFTTLEILDDSGEEESLAQENNFGKNGRRNGPELEAAEKRDRNKDESNHISKSVIEKDIVGIIIENENKDKTTGLGEIGSRLVKKYPDFDVRNYGYSLLSKFLEEMPNLEVKKEDNAFTVALRDNRLIRDEILKYICSVVQAGRKDGIDLGELANLVQTRYKKFNVKDLGYSKFSKFLQSIEGIAIRDDSENRKTVFWRL